MKYFKTLCLTIIAGCSLSLAAQTESADSVPTLSQYISEHPECITQEVVYDGCSLNLNSDGEYLFGQFSILHPELQMRILMQGVTFYIDPTGKKKEKYALHFPSASSVEDVMQQMAPPSMNMEMGESQKPDISPLVAALNEYGAEYDINGRNQDFQPTWASIEINPGSQSLTYSFIIPIDALLKEKKLSDNWRIGLLSEGGGARGNGPGGGPGMAGPGMAGPSIGMNPPEGRERSHDKNESIDLRRMMMKDIETWASFSFNEICSLNE